MGPARGGLRSVPLLSQGWVHALLGLCCVALLATLLRLEISWDAPRAAASAWSLKELAPPGRTLVSYSYFEKDAIQRANLEFFMAVGLVRAGSLLGRGRAARLARGCRIDSPRQRSDGDPARRRASPAALSRPRPPTLRWLSTATHAPLARRCDHTCARMPPRRRCRSCTAAGPARALRC